MGCSMRIRFRRTGSASAEHLAAGAAPALSPVRLGPGRPRDRFVVAGNVRRVRFGAEHARVTLAGEALTLVVERTGTLPTTAAADLAGVEEAVRLAAGLLRTPDPLIDSVLRVDGVTGAAYRLMVAAQCAGAGQPVGTPLRERLLAALHAEMPAPWAARALLVLLDEAEILALLQEEHSGRMLALHWRLMDEKERPKAWTPFSIIEALAAAGGQPPSSVVDAILRELDHPDQFVRRAMVRALIQMRCTMTAALDAFLHRLLVADEHLENRAAIAAAIAELAPANPIWLVEHAERLTDALCYWLARYDRSARSAMADALTTLGEHAAVRARVLHILHRARWSDESGDSDQRLAMIAGALANRHPEALLLILDLCGVNLPAAGIAAHAGLRLLRSTAPIVAAAIEEHALTHEAEDAGPLNGESRPPARPVPVAPEREFAGLFQLSSLVGLADEPDPLLRGELLHLAARLLLASPEVCAERTLKRFFTICSAAGPAALSTLGGDDVDPRLARTLERFERILPEHQQREVFERANAAWNTKQASLLPALAVHWVIAGGPAEPAADILDQSPAELVALWRNLDADTYSRLASLAAWVPDTNAILAWQEWMNDPASPATIDLTSVLSALRPVPASVSRLAAEALESSLDDAEAAPLLGALAAGDSETLHALTQAAMAEWDNWGGHPVRRALRHLTHPAAPVFEIVHERMFQQGSGPESERAVCTALEAIDLTLVPEYADLLASDLEFARPRVRSAIGTALAGLAHPSSSVLASMAACLVQPDEMVRAVAIALLWRWRVSSPEAGELLIWYLKRCGGEQRAAVTRAIPEFEYMHPTIRPKLARLIDAIWPLEDTERSGSPRDILAELGSELHNISESEAEQVEAFIAFIAAADPAFRQQLLDY